MNNFALKNFCLSKGSFMFFLAMILIGSTLQSSAQTLYRATAITALNVFENPSVEPIAEAVNEIKCEGSYLIKDGQLDEIYNLKFVLPSVQLKAQSTNSIIGEQKISFEQTHVMILPMMGMVHFVGLLTIGDVSYTGSFLLKFTVNSDHSISFNGEKTVKLLPYYPSTEVKIMDEVQLDIHFVLKNEKNNLVV